MFYKRAATPLVFVLVVTIFLVSSIGLPRSRLAAKSFAKKTLTFPTTVKQINSIKSATPSYELDIPANYTAPMLFIGTELENLQTKINAATEFNKFAGKLNTDLSNSNSKVFNSKIKSDTDAFIINSKGELFVKLGKKKPELLAIFGQEYFNAPTFKSFEAKAKTLSKVSTDKKKLLIDLQLFKDLKLDTSSITVVFAKEEASKAKPKAKKPAAQLADFFYGTATEINIILELSPESAVSSSNDISNNSSAGQQPKNAARVVKASREGQADQSSSESSASSDQSSSESSASSNQLSSTSQASSESSEISASSDQSSNSSKSTSCSDNGSGTCTQNGTEETTDSNGNQSTQPYTSNFSPSCADNVRIVHYYCDQSTGECQSYTAQTCSNGKKCDNNQVGMNVQCPGGSCSCS